MLEDFIEANSLNAKIFNSIKSFNMAKCSLFEGDDGFVLLVFPFGKMIDFEKLKKSLKTKNLLKIEGKGVEEITGYNEGFVPPISIYGVKVVLDMELEKLEEINILTGEEQTLSISPKEIEASNEEFEIIKF